ncbi:50S ribosomal protein L29 [candidate division WWE3 bacterium]|uniref:Large ribosomal subunit protein uL29 n=1 Tax=candidate division WWE3 bacterium TaxID=2053526 RepID=A0A955LKY6_UNCKA|nr:50S ribosomal protein L29 [candidate division WWE3 bacterium]
MSKRTEEMKQLKEKSLDELVVLSRELTTEIDNERVKSYFGDQTKVNDVSVKRKKLARVKTLINQMNKDKKEDK